eukprot:6208969-Pleurochrysis_carterae.AAC.2
MRRSWMQPCASLLSSEHSCRSSSLTQYAEQVSSPTRILSREARLAPEASVAAIRFCTLV